MGSKPIPGTYSASRVSAIVGLNPYQTRFHIFQILMEENEPGWNAKHGYTLPIFEDSPALRWGSAFEDAVIKLAEEREECEIIDREKLFKTIHFKPGTIDPYSDEKQNPKSIVLTCHIDGMFASGFHKHPVIHEGKTTNYRAFHTVKEEIEEALNEDGQILKGFKLVKKWGEPGTDQVPLEYQVQTAVQRICTGAELVKLSVLVFPRTTEDFEDEGCQVIHNDAGGWFLKNGLEGNQKIISLLDWSRVLSEMGFFHTYNLPSNPPLEKEIIRCVQEFHENHVLTGLPPRAQNYDDIKRLMSSPQGTIIADDKLKALAKEYSELTRQLGASSPNAKRKEKVKIEVLNLINEANRNDWASPPDKISLIDPNGGDELASFGADKNGKLTFRAKRA